ncbi:MAG: hypothetical protein P4L87_08680 [Formivibrio sp.]|nr:hypothetical protein [Formivibrio sp.]
MRNSFFPIALIIVGSGWLLNELQLFPDANWIVILGLISAGILVLVFEGFNSSTIVKGPLLIAAGVASYLNQHHGLGWRVLIPSLLILAGVLLLIAHSGTLPEPGQKPVRRM